MKKITLLLLILMTLSSSHAALKRKRIFHCRNFDHIILVEELFILESSRGSKVFYEVEVPYNDGAEKTFFRKLNLLKTHGARVLTFTTGNYRVKIDRAIPVEKKYKSFVRLPKFDIHSTKWFCKDY